MASKLELDSTLKDLYELNSVDHGEIYLVYTIPTAEVQMTRGIPISSKYAYQDPLSNKDSGIQARIFAQVVPQLFGMIAGKMNLVMFDLDVPGSNDIDPQPRADTADVLGQVSEPQRPMVTYVRNASDIALPPSAIVAVANPMDCLEHLPAAVPLESHYRALSKRELVFSGLPTPPSVVIDTHLNADEVQERQLRAAEVTRMLSVIEHRHLPFVVKLPQALSGQGTFLVRNESDRSETLPVLRQEVGEIALYNAAYLAQENHKLRAENEKARQKRRRSKRQIPNNGGLLIQEGRDLMVLRNDQEREVGGSSTMSAAQLSEAPRRAPPTCSNCNIQGHTRTRCPVPLDT